ncbi:MAG: VOC family protein [Candidatus Heimdallarchaeota archaeon]
MKPKIDLISVITDDLEGATEFYKNVLGFQIQLQLEQYVEFHAETVRFALTTRSVMKEATKHQSYSEGRRGQSFELAFILDSPEEVDIVYDDITKKGAIPVKEPENMPWNQRTAFFADPDGNIHELFAHLEKEV